MQNSFEDRLAALVEERHSQLVLGLDPDPARLWPGAVEAGADEVEDPGLRREAAAAAVARHCALAVEAAGPACVAVKLQLACFERLGAPGWGALESTVAAARGAGLLVIADGKRGDVPVTAAAYAQALLGETPTPWGPVAGLGADAATVNPLLGRDALEPLVLEAEARGAGLFVLVRTSNPGAADVEDLPAPEAPLWESLAAIVAELGVGAVTGATRPEHLVRLRELMPEAVFLLPGVGAQGGKVEDLAPAFLPGRHKGLVTASRSIAGADAGSGPGPAAAAGAAEALRGSAWQASG